MPSSARVSQESAAFLRYCGVGAIGYLSDAGITLLLMRQLSMQPLSARLCALCVAVAVTFGLNRGWSFRRSTPQAFISTLIRYYAVQAAALACNILVFLAASRMWTAGAGSPIVWVSLGSAAGLIVSYLGVRLLVFDLGPAVSSNQG